eukprot:scaffold13829_cov35-Tisochrysis_lutea.AAC.2
MPLRPRPHALGIAHTRASVGKGCPLKVAHHLGVCGTSERDLKTRAAHVLVYLRQIRHDPKPTRLGRYLAPLGRAPWRRRPPRPAQGPPMHERVRALLAAGSRNYTPLQTKVPLAQRQACHWCRFGPAMPRRLAYR